MFARVAVGRVGVSSGYWPRVDVGGTQFGGAMVMKAMKAIARAKSFKGRQVAIISVMIIISIINISMLIIVRMVIILDRTDNKT